MKKTIIALMALAGVSFADTITPMTSGDNWDYGNNVGRGNAALDTNAGTLTLSGPRWTQAYAVYDIKDIKLTSETDTLKVVFTIQASDTDTLLTGAIVGSNGSMVMGHGAYNSFPAGIQYGQTATTTDAFYHLQSSGGEAGGIKVPATNVPGVFAANTPLTLTTDIAWDTSKNQFVATLSYGDNNTTMDTYDLGTTYTLEKLIFSLDGDQSATMKISGVTVTSKIAAVPEPTTATLSLLALAGLAARRRRK